MSLNQPNLNSDERHSILRSRASVGWGGIIGGALLFGGIELLFLLLGTAIGFSAFQVEDLESLTQGMLILSGIYAFATFFVSFYIAGFATAFLNGPNPRSYSVIQALCTWALVVGVFTTIAQSGSPTVLTRTFNVAQSTLVQGGSWYLFFSLFLGAVGASLGGLRGSLTSLSVAEMRESRRITQESPRRAA